MDETILLQPPFHCRRRTRANLFTLLLLIVGGVEVNPGPTSNFRLGMLNTRSIVNKAPLLHSLMDDNEISILALTETWIRSDDPPVIKNGPAPPGYRILHVHHDSNQPAGSDLTRSGGLALIYQDGIQISPHKHQIIHTSFELQLVNICSPGRDFVLANIYRPPSASKSTFLVEFANLLTTLGIDSVNRLIICGDFNLPGNSPNTIDDELSELLHSTSFAQFVDAPTNGLCSILLSHHRHRF